jgi:hypothetical protein
MQESAKMKAIALQSTSNSAPAKKKQQAVAPRVPISPWFTQPISSTGSLVQRKANCACGGGCPSCQSRQLKQPELKISSPSDASEKEADRLAGEMMRAPDGPSQTGLKRSRGSAALNQSRTSSASGESANADLSSLVEQGTSSGGHPLDQSTRAFMEQHFAHDFSDVRVHTDGAAAESAQALSAHAYTIGNNIVFGADKYRPQTGPGKRLVAHELAHVMQQQAGIQTALIQRDCSDPDFCQPYLTPGDAASAEARIRSWYLPQESRLYGANSRALYDSYLSRRPGDSLAPVEFNVAGSDVVSSFAESGDTDDDQDEILDLIGARLSRAPGPLRDNVPTTMSVENFLSRAELDNRPINYSNPFSIAGHIAGGIGSSDAGADYRKVLWGNVTLERIPLILSTAYVHAQTTLHYEVFDAIDFCPGDCGSRLEQLVTVPMSRLEASGEAYDVPFKVTFVPEPRSKRFFYS